MSSSLPRSFSRHARGADRGSALVTVMMLSLALILIVTSTLGYSLNERRLNHREAMRLEARNAAEAVSEYGLAQIRQLMDSRSDFSPTRFTSDESQVAKPATTFWAGSNVVTTGTNAPELIIGLVNPVTASATNTLYYFDPADPNNEFEPLKGRYAFRYDVKVISKTTVQPPTGGAGGPQTCYMTQTLSARASPLFSHAIFYNMDLELHPGPAMTIIGGVHTNGNLYARKNSSSGLALNFVGPVTVAGKILASVAKFPAVEADGGTDTIISGTDNVNYSTAAGGLVGMKNTSNGMWRDQKWGAATETEATDIQFRTWSSQTYQGNLQSALHGVQVANPPGITGYVEDPTPTNGVDNSVNDARKMIDPPLLSSDTGYNAEAETQKYSTRAGIYIVANPSTTTRNGRMPNGTVISVPAGAYRVFSNNNTELVLPGQPTYGVNNTINNTGGNRPAAVTAAGRRPVITLRSGGMTDNRRAVFTFGTSRSATNVYSPRSLYLIDVDITELKLAVDKSVNAASSSAVYRTTTPPDGTTTSALAWTKFIHNSGASTETLDLSVAPLLTTTVISTAAGTAMPAASWNGAIYIQSIDAETRKDSGVRLINGRGRAPSKSDASGLTIATNDALYICGTFNADGTINTATTGTTNSGRYYESSETPCSVACDALTILSQPRFSNNGSTVYQSDGWNDGLSAYRMNDSSWSSSWATTNPSSSNQVDGLGTTAIQPRSNPWDNTSALDGATRTTKFSGVDTEISCAFLTGLVPSNKNGNGQASGGAHNFPRFLEDWSGTAAIRGSLVAMYESRVAMEPWSLRLYAPPTRLWGFNELFNEGRFPPLTPRVMSYRRVDFTDVTKAQYDTLKTSFGL
jgi:hypothetical protein